MGTDGTVSWSRFRLSPLGTSRAALGDVGYGHRYGYLYATGGQPCPLKDESIRARYEVASFTADEVQGCQERLAWIEAHVCLLLETADEGRDLAFYEPRPGYETEPPVPSDTEYPDSQG